jgi:SAM-dependent methyltransferase
VSDRHDTDRTFLQTDAYADSTKLNSRSSLYEFRRPPGSFYDWALARTSWPDAARVLDVGCGPGGYLAALPASVRAVGLDLSPGMAAEAAAHAPALVGDAAQLPFADATFDRLLAPHMLYHCPDIPAAVAELRRVLRPGGVLIAITNDPEHLAELREVHIAAAGGRAPSIVSDRFNLANGGAFLEATFDEVVLERFDGELVVPEVGPLVRYVASMMSWYGDGTVEETLADIERRLQAVIDRDGAFHARTMAGAFLCS